MHSAVRGHAISGATITNVGDRKEISAGAPLRVPSLEPFA